MSLEAFNLLDSEFDLCPIDENVNGLLLSGSVQSSLAYRRTPWDGLSVLGCAVGC